MREKKFKGDNLLWILFLVIGLYVLISPFIEEGFIKLLRLLPKTSAGMAFVNEYYTPTIVPFVMIIVICIVVRKNRFILRAFLPKGMGKNHEVVVIEDTYEATNENTISKFALGLLIGFLGNFFSIACALLHGDIKLYFDAGAAMIPVFIYAFVMVAIQSSSEELWCRGFLYERILIHYPLWVAILVNGVLFGFLHIFNDGVSFMAILGIVVCGIAYSIVRWYTGSIWIVMGIHTMWNFTQNFIFGLPNSGLVSEMSIFHLNAATGASNLIYNYEFGVEAGIPALVGDTVLAVVCLILAKKKGRLGELNLSYERKKEL